MKLTKKQLQNLLIEQVLFSEGLRYHVENSIPLYDCIYRPGSKGFFSLISESRKMYNNGLLRVDEDELDMLNSDLGRFANYGNREVALDFPISQEADSMMMLNSQGFHKSEEVMTRVFNNEFGNEIEVEVRGSHYDDFMDGEKPYEGVFIRITGPDSESSQVVTRMEAETLLELLSNYFSEEPKRLDEKKRRKRRKKKKSKAKKSGSYHRGRKVKLNKPARNSGSGGKFVVYVRNQKTGNIKRITFGARGMTTGLRNPARRKSFAARHRCAQKKDKLAPGYWACRIGRHPKVSGAPYTTWW